MTKTSNVRCEVTGFRPAFGTKQIEFQSGVDLEVLPRDPLGPNGIPDVAADLLDLAAAIYWIERNLSGRQRTNPPDSFKLSMALRNPNAWNTKAVKAASELLQVLGNASWSLEFTRARLRPINTIKPAPGKLDCVFLFSGGLDSACGAVILSRESIVARSVAFYKRQRVFQAKLAEDLKAPKPNQWTLRWKKNSVGRGHSFYYRSFFFLCCAAAAAYSWDARKIIQFENGILATAIPPAPSWMMTKHAHPQTIKLASDLFGALFGAVWKIENPFLLLTKRECVDRAVDVGGKKILPILSTTETCWYQWSNRIPGGKKPPGIACGCCIPCIVRRTALPHARFHRDLRKPSMQNDNNFGAGFRSYFGLLSQLLAARRSEGAFYSTLPASGRGLIGTENFPTLQELRRLLRQFAKEFMATYGVRPG